MLRGLFEGAQYNSEAWAKCAVYSRARTKQGRGVIKEIRYIPKNIHTDIHTLLLPLRVHILANFSEFEKSLILVRAKKYVRPEKTQKYH